MFVVLMQILMKKSTVRNYMFLIPAWILISGCAKMSVPTGGPRDKVITCNLKERSGKRNNKFQKQ